MASLQELEISPKLAFLFRVAIFGSKTDECKAGWYEVLVIVFGGIELIFRTGPLTPVSFR